MVRSHSFNVVSFFPFLLIVLFTLSSCRPETKTEKRMVRLARIVVDSTRLEEYLAFAKEEIETSLRVEPGVLTLYAVSEKDKPHHITILEIYADTAAYQKHIKTPHFLKYKNGTMEMVKSLELIETTPLLPNAELIQRVGGIDGRRNRQTDSSLSLQGVGP